MALLKGVTLASKEQVYQQRFQLNPGAAELVAVCKQAGLKVLMVSGGLTFFSDRVQGRKTKMLLQTCAALGISPTQAIAVGDGANVLPMMTVAGLSVAYHAKPAVCERTMVCINTGGLDRLLTLF